MTDTVVIRPPRNHGARLSDGETRIVLDATVTEEHRISAEVSDHPLETGAVVSDHVRVRPVEVVLTNVHTVTPTLESQLAPDRDREAWRTLRRLAEARVPLTVHTSLEVYRSMVITELSTSQSANVGQSIRPVIRLRQIQTASAELVEIPAELLRDDVEDDAQEGVDSGDRGAEDPDDAETDAVRRTGLATAYDLLPNNPLDL